MSELRIAEPVLTIALDRIQQNYRSMAALAPNSLCAAVVKADAYGLGAEQVAKALAKAGAQVFFVAHFAEGMALRAEIPHAVIYVLNGLQNTSPADFAARNIRPVLSDWADIERFSAFCRTAGHRSAAALQVDTGMNRLGLDAAQAALVAELGPHDRAFDLTLLMSHFACADDAAHPMNARQIERFAQVRGLFPGISCSLANSAGIVLPQSPHFDMVRPGIALYGGAFSQAQEPLASVLHLRAPILQIRSIRSGEIVGYGGAYVAPSPRTIATVAVGYGDGYPRAAGGQALAIIDGHACPVVGRVSMDMLAVDVTEAGSPQVGDCVELLGDDNDINALAQASDTIAYEILTRLGRRYRREWLSP